MYFFEGLKGFRGSSKLCPSINHVSPILTFSPLWLIIACYGVPTLMIIFDLFEKDHLGPPVNHAKVSGMFLFIPALPPQLPPVSWDPSCITKSHHFLNRVSWRFSIHHFWEVTFRTLRTFWTTIPNASSATEAQSETPRRPVNVPAWTVSWPHDPAH